MTTRRTTNSAGQPVAEGPVWEAYQVAGALQRRCPRCAAEPEEACENPITGEELTLPCLDRIVDRKIPHAEVPGVWKR